MNAKQFKDAIRRLKAVPADACDQFLSLASGLSSEEQEGILIHLTAIDAELQKNEREQAATLARGQAMVNQIEQHDMPIFDALFRAE